MTLPGHRFTSRVISAALIAAITLLPIPPVAQADDPPSPGYFLRGDSNGDGRVDISDPIRTLNWLFNGAAVPPCLDAADANDSGKVDISDAIFTLNFLFTGGREPPPPGPRTPGGDPTPDNLSCARSLDTTAPTITGLTPAHGTLLNDPRPAISARYTDSQSGIDIASIRLTLDAADVTAQSSVTAGSITFTPAGDLANGSHTALLSVSDRVGNRAQAQTTFQVWVNHPPVLNPINNQSVSVGRSLKIPLSATDLDNDPLTFSVSPLPLPANSRFNRTTGEFEFTPDLGQVGVLVLIFSVTDGLLTAVATVTIAVEGPVPGQPTSLSGRLLDTNDTVEGRETPVVGAKVSLLGTGFSAFSDGEGRFLLTGIPSGSQILDIDTSQAHRAPDGSPYSGFREEIGIIAGVANVVERPIFLPRIAMESMTEVNPDVTTVVTNPTLGTTMTVPPHTAKNPDGSDFTGELSISEVPKGLAPAALPEELQPGLLITIQPVGVTFSTPVPITFPNIDRLPPGTQVDIWSLDPKRGIFVVVGIGRVSGDGVRIETVFGGIRAADWHMALAPAGRSDATVAENNQDNQGGDDDCPFRTGVAGTTVVAQTGGLRVDPTLPTTRSLGVSRGLEFIYSSTSADVRPILPFDATILFQAAVPPALSYRLSVSGLDQGTETFIDTSRLSEDRDETIRAAIQWDTSEFPTGSYPYALHLTSHYPASSVASTVQGKILVNNQIQSPFGAGGGIAGLYRLYLQRDASVVLTEGDGSAWVYEAGQGGEYRSPPGDFSHLRRNADGTFTRVLKDGTRQEFNSEGLQVAEVDRNGNATRYRYDPEGHLVEVEDPVGLVTRLSYTGGRLSSVTDPGKRSSTFTYDGAGNLIRIVYPDGTSESLAYDLQHRLTTHTDPRGHSTRYDYDFAGRMTQVTLPDGSTRRTTYPQQVGLVDPSNGTGTRTSPAAVRRPSEAEATYTDGEGHVTRMRLDRFGGPLLFTDPLGRTTTVVRNENGLPIRVTRPDGSVVVMRYDARGNLLSTLEGGIQSTDEQVVIPYEASGYRYLQVPQGIVPAGFEQEDFDDSSFPVGDAGFGNGGCILNPRTFWDMHTSLILRKWFDLPTGVAELKVKVAIDNDIQVFINGVDVSRGVQQSENCAVRDRFIFSVPGDLIKSGRNLIVVMAVDRGGLTYVDLSVVIVEHAGSIETHFTYEPTFNQVTSITDPNGNVTRIEYDARGNPVAITDAQGNLTTLAYDQRGLLTSVTDPLGNLTPAVPDDHQTQFRYDATIGNLLATTDPLGQTTTLTYDSAGNVATSTDSLGRATGFTYDPMNRLTSVLDAGTGRTSYGYDPAGNLVSVTDANNQTTRFGYDALNRLIQATNPLGQTESYTYDANGNLIETLDAKGQRISFTYDAAGQLKTKLLRNSAGEVHDTVQYDYDEVGNLTLVQDADSKLTFRYDLLGHLIATTTGDAANPALHQPVTTLTSTYDPAGNRLTLVNSTGEIAYAYDALNRLTSLSLPTPNSSLRFAFTHDALSRRTGLTLPNGTEVAYAYDDASQLLSMVHRLTALPQTILAQANYTYDPVGNRDSLGDLAGQHQFGYDVLNRLTSANHPPASRLVPETFTYDRVGNRTRSHLSATHRHDAANRLLEDDRFTYTYDANGNRTEKREKTTGATTTHTYDPEDQLFRVDLPGGKFSEYKYDGLGRRIEKKVNGTIIRYVYDNEDIILEYDATVRPELVEGRTPSAHWVHGPGIDEPLMMERDLNANGTFEETERFFYHADGLGSTIALTNNTGQVVERYRYDSFGQPTILGPGPDGLIDTPDDVTLTESAYGNPYLFTSREWDAETGLYFYRARYLDPRTGTFLQEDPVAGFLFIPQSLNQYPYVENNPINFTDPFGLKKRDLRNFEGLEESLRFYAQIEHLLQEGLIFSSIESVGVFNIYVGGKVVASGTCLLGNPVTFPAGVTVVIVGGTLIIVGGGLVVAGPIVIYKLRRKHKRGVRH